MSQTPRTDTYYGVVGEKQTRGTKQDADFASQLERELAEWKARAEAVEGELAEVSKMYERCKAAHHALANMVPGGVGMESGQLNAAQAAQNAAGQSGSLRNTNDAKAGDLGDSAPAAPIADPQVPEVREAPGNRPIASSPASSALVSKEDVLAIIRGEKAAWNEPSNTAYTVCENIAESVRLLECAAPASGPSEADIRGALARGYCSPENAHKILDPDVINAMTSEILRLLGGKP